LQRLLRFLSKFTNAEAPSQYIIATEVFGRPTSFDADADPIVRVEVRRLRQKLDEYYQVHADEPLRIRIPVQSYRVTAESHDGRPPRIAVLPLHYLSDGDSFALGAELADDLIHALGRCPEVAPLARTSVFALHTRGRTAEEIVQDTGADWLLEGSVRRGEERCVFRTALVRCSNMTFAWHKDFSCAPDGLPHLPELIAAAVLATIAPQGAMVRDKHIPAADAHILYLRGAAAFRQGMTESVRQSIDFFRAAIREDPFYVRPRVALQEALLLPFATGVEISGACEQAIALAEECEALESGSADALLASGNAKLGCQGDWAGAAADYRRAIDLEPHSVAAYLYYVPYLAICGDLEEAQRMTRFAMSLDPLSPIVHHRLVSCPSGS
jgi:TolB-like protein